MTIIHHHHENEVTIKTEHEREIEKQKNQVPKKVLTINDKICMLAAEVIGTGLLVFFGCMGCIDWIEMPGLPISASLNFGLTVMFVVHIFGHISHAIINPVIVITAVIHKILDIQMGLLYVVAELIGACLGYGLLVALTPQKHFDTPDGQSGLCITNLHPSVSVTQGFFIEFFVTSTLVLVVCSVWDPRNKDKSDSAAIRIGLTVAALCFAAAPSTVASMNPARSFGPALWNWEWENHWMYWVSTSSASFVTSYFYKIVFWKDPEEKSTNL